MSALHLHSLAFSFSPLAPLFDDVTLHLSAGWTGLVGSNGAGKTTFLRLLHGELTPHEGQLRFEPAAARVTYCRQSVEELDDEIQNFAWAWDRDAQKLRGQLELEPQELDRWPTLSPGERKRWQLAAALHAEPDVLLLDEPTNHLDAEARDQLSTALRQFAGVGVLVSHDRQLLDELTTSTVRLQRGGARLWSGNYSAAMELWEADEAANQQSYEQSRREERKLRRRLADKRRQRASADSKIHARSRMKSVRDHDARSAAAKGRVQAAESSLSRQVGVLRRQVERQQAVSEGFEVSKAKGRSLFVDFQPAPKAHLVTLDLTSLQAGGEKHGKTLLAGSDGNPLGLHVRRDARIWLAGANGSGKTTLLRRLLAASTVPAPRLLYLPQELTVEDRRRLLDEVRELPTEERGRVLELVAALGCDPEHLLASELPSPGEARKLKIASGLGRQVWALLLDEPTNHLDLPSIQRLEAMLTDYPGALVLISHDRPLALACTNEVWRLSAGGLDMEATQHPPL